MLVITVTLILKHPVVTVYVKLLREVGEVFLQKVSHQ